MKKVLFAIAMIAVVALSGCSKPEPKIQKRLVMCGDAWDKYVFTYDADGKIANVNRNEGEKTWAFTWAGKVGTAHYIYVDKGKTEEEGDWVFTLGDNGFISTLVNNWGDTWSFTYDANGYLTKVERPDRSKVVANCVWENGNLKKWSRFKDDGTEEFKNQTFLPDENVAGIFPDATDKAGVDRWIFELGFCGKPSKCLLDQAAWEGSDAIAVQTYEKDADGFVTKVNKVYGTDDPEIYQYQWEVISGK